MKEVSPFEVEFQVKGRILLTGKITVTPGISESLEVVFKNPHGHGTIMECKDNVMVKYEGVLGSEMKKKIEECAVLSLVKRV
jgi:hypothetical protein